MKVFSADNLFTICFLSGDYFYDGFCPCPNSIVITGNYGDALFDHPLSTSFDGVVKKMLTKCQLRGNSGRGRGRLIKKKRLIK